MNKQRNLIYSGFLISIFTLLGFALFYLARLDRLEEYRNQVDHSNRIIFQIGKLTENLLNAETGQRGFIITQDSAFLTPYINSYQAINSNFLELDSLTRSSKEQQIQLDTLKALIQVSTLLLKENVSNQKSAKEFAEEFSKSRYYMEKIRTSMEKLKEREVSLLQNHDSNRQSTFESSTFSSYAILIFAFLLCFVGTLVIIKFFNKILRYQKDLNENIYKLESLNKEIISLSFASSHNLQEPTRKVQIIIDRMEYDQNPSPALISENFAKIKRIFAKQQETNKLIIDYYSILNRPVDKSNIDLKPFIQELIQLKNWDNEALIQIEDLPKLQVDAVQVKRLFSNLIENCISFNRDQPDLRIEICEIPFTSISNASLPNLQNGFHVICIADNGIGVPQELHEKIFELFQKTDDRTELASKPGVGLSFSKRIMLNHDGWIEAHNNAPKGFKIYLFFPI
ncbi:MAG: CHASE3 domain-containing protein [Crocinitomicaceae bacterium]|nr:CHASE3 domain-containing protein [Crocinitomicaceae bacterium]